MCNLAVVPRPGCGQYDLSFLDTIRQGSTQRTVLVPAPLLDISGTVIRARVARGQSIRYQVPAAVEDYIMSHHLYQQEKGRDR